MGMYRPAQQCLQFCLHFTDPQLPLTPQEIKSCNPTLNPQVKGKYWLTTFLALTWENVMSSSEGNRQELEKTTPEKPVLWA